jgi:hypothetical protein
MLSLSELKAWYGRLNLNEPAQKLIDHVRSSEPARRVGGGPLQCKRALSEPKDGCDHSV